MPFTEFCCRSGGSNLNAGTRTGSSTEPGIAADLTYASGTWVNSTAVFTVASGDPVADGVAVGDFASVYPDAATVTPFVGRVTERTTTTITVSSSEKAGTKPADGTTNTTLKIGGAWQGPNGASGFPFAFASSSLRGSGDGPRVNFKNDQTYQISAAITHNQNGARFEGYSTSYGDEAFAVMDSQANSITTITVSGSNNYFRYLSGLSSSTGATNDRFMVITAPNGTTIERCNADGFRWEGFGNTNACQFIECEAFNCSLGAIRAGFVISGPRATFLRCVAYNNSGKGFWVSNGDCMLQSCISANNSSDGVFFATTEAIAYVRNCDIYSNGGNGIEITIGGLSGVNIENTNLVANGGYGVNISGAGWRNGRIYNCGFGAGTKANTSGSINNQQGLIASDTVDYAADVTPWIDPDNGDFRIALAAAKGAGRGAFLQTKTGYGGTVGYPDIGAAQSQASGGPSRPVNPFTQQVIG